VAEDDLAILGELTGDDPANLAEQRALEKAGFTREGLLRGIGWRDGAWRDGIWFSVLRTDLDG
jgi:RimJ/RimL family protein N-acetyltransferase